MRGTTTYFAQGGKVFAKTPTGVYEVSTALSASGRDLERFEAALNVARQQQRESAPKD
jgi:hypothetical protein